MQFMEDVLNLSLSMENGVTVFSCLCAVHHATNHIVGNFYMVVGVEFSRESPMLLVG